MTDQWTDKGGRWIGQTGEQIDRRIDGQALGKSTDVWWTGKQAGRQGGSPERDGRTDRRADRQADHDR